MSRVAIVGGTGDLGMGLGARLSKAHQVTLGSRDLTRAHEAAGKVTALSGVAVAGDTNERAVAQCEIAVLAIPELPAGGFLLSLKPSLAGKLVISPIAPMKKIGRSWFPALPSGSAAQRIASVLETKVAAAFQTVPAPRLLALGEKLDYDVLVAAGSREVYDEAAALISSIEGLRPLYAGGLRSSRMIEGMPAVLRNIGRLNKLRTPTFKVV